MDVTKIVQPGIELFGIEILEPVTSITDVMIGLVCFYGFVIIKPTTRTNTYIRYYFLTMGIASTLGGIFNHAFLYLMDERIKAVAWILSMLSVALIERAAISHTARIISKKMGNFFLVLNIVELVTLMFLTLSTMQFRFVEFHSAYGFLIVVTSFHYYSYRKTKDRGSLWMLRNTVVLLIAVFVFNYPVILHTYFNHKDFAHILMIIASFMIIKATQELGKTTPAPYPG